MWLEQRIGVGANDERRLVGVGEQVAGHLSIGRTCKGVSSRRADHEERLGLASDVVYDCRCDIAAS